MKNKIKFQIRLSQLATSFFAWAACVCIMPAPATAQNISSGEPVQVVGQFNGYVTTPYNSDYRTAGYRRVSVTTGTPTDGRGQWATTMNAQSSGGDFVPINMGGGGGNGFLFISGPSGNRFQNKWVFSGVGQGALNSINNITAYNSGNDMGLNMSTAGRYTFVFNDAGYTQANAKYYVGYTANAPVTVTRTSQTYSAGAAVISITTGGTPSAGENIYVRYRITTNDFTASTSVVQATGSGTAWSATIPGQPCGTTVYYYVYSSTRTLAQINGDSEMDRSLATLRYDDNSGSNYSYTSTAPTAAITNNTGTIVITCTTPAISLTATGGGTYLWSSGATPSSASQSYSAAGTYTVTVTDANGCTASTQITITSNTTPPAAGITNNTGTTVLTCTITSISLTATGGGTYLWDGGSTSAARSITAAGTYTVTVTAANGCTASTQTIITSNTTPPAVGATAAPSTICVGNSSTLTGSGATTYSWMPGSLSGAPSVTPVATTTYTVTGTDAATGCTASNTVTVTVNANPIILTSVKSNAALFGGVGTAGVTALPAGCTFLWSPGGQTTNYIQNQTPGTYSVTITAPGGCTKTTSITIN